MKKDIFRKNKFDCIINLGYDCQVAYHYDRMGLRSFSGPFDWFMIPLSALLGILSNDFRDYFAYNNLKIIKPWCPTHLQVEDTKYHLTSLHDFTTKNNTENLETYPDFIAKIKRRQKRFLYYMEHAKNILFIRKMGMREEFLELEKILLKKRKGKPFHIIAIGYDDDFKKDWEVPNISTHYLEHDEYKGDWKGCPAEWTAILKHVRLTNKWQRLKNLATYHLVRKKAY